MKKEQVKFEVRSFADTDGMVSKGIFIDGRHFDWGVDEESVAEAVRMGPKFVRSIQADIARHFLDSLSEFMNREVTQEEVDKATKTGWINI